MTPAPNAHSGERCTPFTGLCTRHSKTLLPSPWTAGMVLQALPVGATLSSEAVASHRAALKERQHQGVPVVGRTPMAEKQAR
jgi:hypothetical protein